jgi:Spy/CpxP family protein refolding chaperone
MRQVGRVSGGVSAPCLVIGALVIGLGLGGCDKDSSNATAPAASAPAVTASVAVTPPPPAPTASAAATDTAEDEAVNEELRDYHRHHHHGGVTMFISMAIDTLGLEPAKKAQVEKIQSDLHTKMAPARDAEHDLLSTIADGVAAGKIDPATVDASVAKIATASAGIHTATLDAVTQLHDALSPVERAALVDKVKAHWEVWHKVNVDEKSGSKDKGTRLDRLTELLALTPDQVTKIGTALSAETPVTPQTDPKAVDTYIDAFSTAFLADKFDPKALAAPATGAAGHIARHGAGRLAHFYEAITPILTPDQRTKLATHLRERLSDQHVASTK